MNLNKKCNPCESGTKPLSGNLIKNYLKHVKNWEIINNKLSKEFKFKDFKEALKFVNKISIIAEKENNHPDIYFTWGKCRIILFTHSINGLSENDFIVASKIDKLK